MLQLSKGKETFMDKKLNTPKKGAAKKWAERWKKLREQPPSEELINILNKSEKPKKIASPLTSKKDLDV